MKNVAIMLICLIIMAVGVIFLQYKLSRNSNKWLGLVIPAICFLYSIIMVCSFANFDGTGSWQLVFSVVCVFLISNVPTAILLTVYLYARSLNRKNEEINKMNIKDL